MPQAPRPPARSYDEIVRRTVPEPDSSFRPTPAQERAAYEGARFMSPDEQQLHDRVIAALEKSGDLDLSAIEIEVADTRIELRGQAPDMNAIDEVEQRIAKVAGVTSVTNRLVVRTG